MVINKPELIRKKRLNLLSMLQEGALEKKRSWWNNYMRQVIEFRGIGIPDIREMLKLWYETEGIDNLSLQDQYSIALELLSGEMAEDKLAGVLMIQIYLIDQIPWEQQLENLEVVFKSGFVFDWNTCDWLCIRVIGPLIKANGQACAKRVLSWQMAENLWQARSSVVSFVYLVKAKNYHPAVFNTCRTLLTREERFAKTAVGWVLREISKDDPAGVLEFVKTQLKGFSLESLRNAMKYYPENTRKPILVEFKSQLKSR